MLAALPATAGLAQAVEDAVGPPAARHGVAVDLASIHVDERVTPGRSYPLPPVRVRNPGTAGTSYAMSLRPGGDHRETPSDWLRFTPNTFELASGASQLVAIDLVVPPGAVSGRYSGLLAAQISGALSEEHPDGAGATVGAAAATHLEFTVSPASLLSGWVNALRSWLTSKSPWSWLGIAAAVLAVPLWRLSRRVHVRVEWSPRS